jgi:peptide/nickel transport system ATP-binding protein
MDQNEKKVLLSVQNLDVAFKKGKKAFKVIDNVSFDIYKGETLSLVGESGSGKTTIGRAIVRINPCTAGAIYFDGKKISGKLSRKEDRDVVRKIQMIFQDPSASLNERATIEYIISEGLYNFHLFKDEKDRVAKVEEITKEVGLLPEHLTRYPHEFSGGQRQRICIARALALKPQFVVCDEPVSALDVSIQAQIINLLKKLQEDRGLTYLFISHDLSVVEHISDTIGVMYLGNLVETGNTEDIFSNPLHPYTKALFSAIPMPDPEIKKDRILLQGDIPSPANPPKGCKFHTRCSQCMGKCKEVAPVPKDMGNGHVVCCHLYDQE